MSDEVLKTLRAFEAEKPNKGCYSVPVGMGRKVLVRVWFYYGNYDGKEDPPTFRLQFDANAWDVIETTPDGWSYREAVYVTKTNAASICVARGSTGQTPFISGFLVAVLREDMYDSVNSSVALFRITREAFGANKTIRDKYGRDWANTAFSLNISEYNILSNTAAISNAAILGDVDDAPAIVFHSAVSSKSKTSNITITTPYLESNPRPIYFNMYFTDLVDPAVRKGGNRSFYFILNGEVIFNKFQPIVPAYGMVEEYASTVRMGDRNTVIDLVPTADATLSPIISAWELFVISDQLNDGTDGRDVNGLSTLQHQFETLKDWAGDPCLPMSYNWEWLACNSDPSPRIKELDLSGYGLSGTLPDFSLLDALEVIDLSNNSLTGDIPTFLGELPNLLMLKRADNDFSSIPSSLTSKSNIQLDVSGNPKLPCIGKGCNLTPTPQPNLTVDVSGASTTKSKNTILMAIFVVCMMYVITIITW